MFKFMVKCFLLMLVALFVKPFGAYPIEKTSKDFDVVVKQRKYQKIVIIDTDFRMEVDLKSDWDYSNDKFDSRKNHTAQGRAPPQYTLDVISINSSVISENNYYSFGRRNL